MTSKSRQRKQQERLLEQERAMAARKKREDDMRKARQVSSGIDDIWDDAIAMWKRQKNSRPRGEGKSIIIQIANILHEMDSNDQASLDALKRLIEVAIKQTKLFKSNSLCNITGSCQQALAHIAKMHKHWISKPEDFVSRTYNLRRQASSMARFLIAKYELPAFMDSVWFISENKNNKDLMKTAQEWFVCISQGGNIRKANNLPFPLTKKMAHLFTTSPPKDLNAHDAMRWSQVIALGGSNRTALAIIEALPNSKDHEFWTTVVQFFANNTMIDTHQIGPIIDYIDNQKFTSLGDQIINGRVEHLGPPQPNFSMKGRTAQSLLRQTEEWHARLYEASFGSKKDPIAKTWSSCGIKTWAYEEGTEKNKTIFTIQEILSRTALVEEGRKMRHCVSICAAGCSAGRISIFSAQKISEKGGRQRLFTIKVDRQSASITEARGFANAPLNAQEKNILRRWAQSRGLNLHIWI